jgi:uncharacterized protein (TIGR02466 family)
VSSSDFERSSVHALFPSLVWEARLGREEREPLNRAILGRLEALRQGAPALAEGQFWQSPVTLHEHAELAPLCAAVARLAAGVLEFLRIGECGRLQITGCWANVNAPRRAHPVHAHPNNFLSGVYYVKVPPGADTVNFHDPRPQAAVLRPPVTELTSANTDQVVLRVAEGTLLLFPAWLAHSVDANASAALRVSVSFNLMFPRYGETLGAPLWA